MDGCFDQQWLLLQEIKKMCEKCKNHEPNEETKAAMVRARNLPSARFDNFGDLMESIRSR